MPFVDEENKTFGEEVLPGLFDTLHSYILPNLFGQPSALKARKLGLGAK